MWFFLQAIWLSATILLLAWNTDEDIHLSYLTVAFTLMRWSASNGPNLWFWFRGLDIPNPHQCMELRVFLFANYGDGTAFKFFSISSALFSLVWVFYLFPKSITKRGFIDKGTFQERFEVECFRELFDAMKPVAEGGEALEEKTTEGVLVQAPKTNRGPTPRAGGRQRPKKQRRI
jgi:hypothetical protein